MIQSVQPNLLLRRSRLMRGAVLAWICLIWIGLAANHVRATTVIPPEFATLVNESDYIVRVVTRHVSAEKRNGPRGSKIYTRVSFDIVEVVAGSPPAALTLEFLGGRVGDAVMTVGGMPQFHVGDEEILFVRGNGQSICPLYAMMHGRYTVGTETASGRKFVARSDGTPLQSIAQISTVMSDANHGDSARRAAALASALPPAEFVQQIKATVRPDARLNRAR